ncbi:hypothetical protein C943_04078 [Mariniradius saccharolyticus AK6]|uniref:Uncharacterized protein n=1 Tax=Mariniradius saccharolyticus AK6 TaxID=1239962 RepID=M7XA09_9BACT|nr:hypothetical protein C943_04078 [Mariniradius saccharolyticus AK6]
MTLNTCWYRKTRSSRLKIFFATNGHISRVVQMTGTFHQIKIQKNNEKDQFGNAQTQFR